MIREDNNTQFSFTALVFGLIIVLMVVGFAISEGSSPSYLVLSFGFFLLILGVFLLMRRARSLSRTYSMGQEVKGRVADCRIGGGGRAGPRTALEISFTFRGKPYTGKTTLPYVAPFAAGTEVTIIVDPDDPEKFVLRDSYETERGAIEASTDICSVCQEQIPFLEVNNHMKAVHPREYIAWKLWMASVVLSFVVPIAAMILSVLVFNDERVLVVVIIAIAVIVFSTFAIDKLGTRWEAKVNKAWKASRKNRKA